MDHMQLSVSKGRYLRSIGLLLLMCLVYNARAQENNNQSALYFFKVWGFLKYNHPALASGKIDADSVFMANLPAANTSLTKAQLNARLQVMLQQLSTVVQFKPAVKEIPVKELTQNVNRQWYTKNGFLTPQIRAQLVQIFNNRFTDSSYYYTPKQFVADLPHEKAYSFADTAAIPYAYRMLSLAKVQAAVDYLFPHKYLMDDNWDDVVSKAIAQFAKANNRLAFETELMKISSHLNDTHSFRFYKSTKNWKKILKVKYYPPFSYTVINNGTAILVADVLIPELCAAAQIKKGDVITKINGQPVAGRIKYLQELLSASNKNALVQRLNRYYDNLLFPTDSIKSTLTYLRNKENKTSQIEWVSKQKDFAVLTDYVNKLMAPLAEGKELEYAAPGVVIFRAGETTRFLNNIPKETLYTTMDSLFQICENSKAIIFDMRTYPDWGGFMYLLYNRFGKDRAFFANYYKFNKQDAGTFKLITDTIEYFPPIAKPGGVTYKGKVIIITNGETLSAGEYYTMFLQHLFPQGITIGEQSAGADGDEKVLTLPGNYQFPFTGNAIFYPDGTEAQRKGVKIDQVVHPSIQDILDHKDTMLEKALQLIRP